MFEKVKEKVSKIVIDKYGKSTGEYHQKHLANIAFTILKFLPPELVIEAVPNDIKQLLNFKKYDLGLINITNELTKEIKWTNEKITIASEDFNKNDYEYYSGRINGLNEALIRIDRLINE